MSLYCFFTELKLLSDVTITASIDDAAHDLQLAWREAIGFVLRRKRSVEGQRTERVNEAGRAPMPNPVVSY